MKLATIELVTNISPIKDADRIETVNVLGWTCVVKKGTFKVGDKAVYIREDTLVPEILLNEKGDRDKKIRIKIVKMKGQVSAGLLLPLSILTQFGLTEEQINQLPVGAEVASYLGVEKYEKPIPASLAGQVKGDFPSRYISKTDEDNLLSNLGVLDELEENEELEITLKMDGTSATYIFDPESGSFHVCSRNLELTETDTNTHWQLAKTYRYKEVLEIISKENNDQIVCVQGEICGPKINGNNMGLAQPVFYPFNLKIGPHYQDRSVLEYVAKLIKSEPVPLVKRLKITELGRERQQAIHTLQHLANHVKYENNAPAEGIVIRTVPIKYSPILQKMWSVKVKNQNYKD